MIDTNTELQLLSPPASPEEAAAVMAALRRFAQDTTPAPSTTVEPRDPWLRAAMLEGASLEDWGAVSDPWLNT